MKRFAVSALAQTIRARPKRVTPHELQIKGGDFLTGVSIDSRTTKAGDCFFAISGENFDGHNYISDAFAKGAVCAVVSKDTERNALAGRTMLRVNDTVKALGDFAREYRRQAGFKVVAITGSVGKTMTRQIVYHVLRQHFRVSQSPRNFNNHIGLPLTLLGADPESQIVVAEMGTNHPGEIAYLTRIALPDVAVITNVYPAHLEGFGDLPTITQEKLSISEGLSRDGVLVINADIMPPQGRGLRVVTFGKSDGSDYQARDISCTGLASAFTIVGPKGSNRIREFSSVRLPVPGLGNVENALAAWAVCNHFGLTSHDFAHALGTLTTVSMRVEPLQIGTLTVINDCYNANPASMNNALDILTKLNSAGNRRLVFICGDMAELGQSAQALHVELGASIAQAKVQVLLAVGKFANIVAEAAQAAAPYDLQARCFEDGFGACNILHEFIRDNDIILVKGSRVGKLEMVTERLKELCSQFQAATPDP